MCDQFKVIPSFELSRQAEIRAPSETEAFSMNRWSEPIRILRAHFLFRSRNQLALCGFFPEQRWPKNIIQNNGIARHLHELSTNLENLPCWLEFINLNRYHFHIESIHKTNTCSWKHRVNPRSSKSLFFCGLPNNFILVNWMKGRNSTPKGKITPQEF